MPTGELRLNAEQYLMNTYTRQPISIVRGRGSKVYDLEGRPSASRSLCSGG